LKQKSSERQISTALMELRFHSILFAEIPSAKIPSAWLRGLLSLFLLTGTVCTLSFAPPAHAAQPAVLRHRSAGNFVDESLLRDAGMLDGPEIGSPQAATRLKNYPRAALVTQLRAWLKAPEASNLRQPAALIIETVHLHELQPELSKIAETTTDWHLFLALQKVSGPGDNAALSQLYLKRLNENLPDVTRLTILDGLSEFETVLPRPVFDSLLVSENFRLREAAVVTFLNAHKKYSVSEQADRFRQAFALRPYQVRLKAMKFFAHLPVSEKTALRAALIRGPVTECEQEENLEVKTICRSIASTPKGSHP
jgi:hypothetical protein